MLIKTLPAFDPSKEVGAKVREINAALNMLELETDTKVKILDMWQDFTNVDGSLKSELYSDKHLHLSLAGYEILAARLKLLIENHLKNISSDKPE